MANVLDSVDQRTKLVGKNRMELLLFKLDGDQVYGINVFKVREVCQCPELNKIPQSHPVVLGVADFRGQSIPVIDLNHAIGGEPTGDLPEKFIIVTEYNLNIQALLVSSVDRIINRTWAEIQPPPPGATASGGSYLTAVTEYNEQLIEMIDVEKVLTEVTPGTVEISEETLSDDIFKADCQKEILVIDDSSVARAQLKKGLEALGMSVTTMCNGLDGLKYLQELSKEGDVDKKLLMIISDIEMPEMDGYTFTTHVRETPNLENMFVVLHTSLSGGFNKTLVEQAGANEFISKYQPEALASVVKGRIEQVLAQQQGS